MDKRIDQITDLIKKDFKLFSGIMFGVFFFVLFFQPFPIDKFDFNNRLVFIAGLGAIVFLFTMITRLSIKLLISYATDLAKSGLPFYLEGFLLFLLNTVAFAFYLRYVGKIEITFLIMFRVALIGLIPPIVLRLNDRFNELKIQNEVLTGEKKTMQEEVAKFENNNVNSTVEFVTDDNYENLTLRVADVVLVKSADNYVEITFIAGKTFTKRLIRNTLKNVEVQVKSFPNFIRCHRSCIVNSDFIAKLNRNYSSYWLTLKNMDDKIPVSRQYLLKIKEAL